MPIPKILRNSSKISVHSFHTDGLANGEVFDYGATMPEQIKKSSSSRKSNTPTADTQVEPSKEAKNLTADLDSLLDEIDEVLESNAEEFVKSYVQKGGQ